MYAAGQTTGLSLECGDGVTSLMAIEDGYDIVSRSRSRGKKIVA